MDLFRFMQYFFSPLDITGKTFTWLNYMSSSDLCVWFTLLIFLIYCVVTLFCLSSLYVLFLMLSISLNDLFLVVPSVFANVYFTISKDDDLIWFIVFNATFSNILAISWRPVLVVEEAGVPGENHRPRASNW